MTFERFDGREPNLFYLFDELPVLFLTGSVRGPSVPVKQPAVRQRATNSPNGTSKGTIRWVMNSVADQAQRELQLHLVTERGTLDHAAGFLATPTVAGMRLLDEWIG
jgi:hypothetical protein